MMPPASPYGYVVNAVVLDEESARWLAFAIEELERKVPKNALQLPPMVKLTFATVRAIARRNAAGAAARAFESIENSATRVENDATVEPMTVSEAARDLSLTSTRVAQMAAAGELEATKVGRQWRIDRQSVEAEKARRAASS